MTVYHGSGVPFETVDLSFGTGEGLEFGAGFYATLSENLALEYAFLAMQELELSQASVHTFDFEAEAALKNLNVLTFDGVSAEWFEYVKRNLDADEYPQDYDLVIGPVENETAWKLMQKYEAGALTKNQFLAGVSDIGFDVQLAFKTEKSLQYLSNHRVMAIRREEQ